MRWSLPEIFGTEHFYLELQDHGLPEQREVNRGLLQHCAGDGRFRLLRRTTAHYLTREDSCMLQDVLLCIQTGQDRRRSRTAMRVRDAEEFYLKTEAEMRALFPAPAGGARQHAAQSPTRCNLEIEFGHDQAAAPSRAPDGERFHRRISAASADEGSPRALPGSTRIGQYRRAAGLRARSVVEKMGYVDYYLIVGGSHPQCAKDPRAFRSGRGAAPARAAIAAYCIAHHREWTPCRYHLHLRALL